MAAVKAASPGRPRLIGGTLGSHIAVDRFDGAPSIAVYAEAEDDGRPFFIIPWNGILLIGTTDVPFEGDPDLAEVSARDLAYLINSTNRLFPSASLDTGDVLQTWCGVRPLPSAPGKGAAAITRRHLVHDHAPETEGLISLIGGKLTTYRHLSAAAGEAAAAVSRAGGSVLAIFRDPLGGHWQVLAGLPVDKVEPTPYQRDR